MKHFGRYPKTMLFSASVADGTQTAKEFTSSLGIRAEQLSYRDTDKDREGQILDEFRQGDVDMLISVDKCSRGVDVPDVECIVMMRPFRRSMIQVVQQIGRGARPAPGKTICLLLDPARNFDRFRERIENYWAHGLHSLDEGKLKELRAVPDEDEEGARTCKKCSYIMPEKARECPMCGFRPQRKGTQTTQPGVLKHYKRIALRVGDLWPHICRFAHDKYRLDRISADDDVTPDTARRFALRQHKEMTGRWPTWGRPFEPAATCDPQVEEAIRERMREYGRAIAKRRAIEKNVARKKGAA